ncbi:hypothetical protein [Sphingomonas hylomeconis]|uniref:HNH endonuclease n=1 Tax=Sphingomonas hylomeconis TaxID=1395958 RepID=A0ABV7SRJ7_9SPHN|nr:hypothetical protein [Sphingomonas hylomeconis]
MTTPQTESRRFREREAGRASARAWRAKNKPVFDAIYGAEACTLCGKPHSVGASQTNEGNA